MLAPLCGLPTDVRCRHDRVRSRQPKSRKLPRGNTQRPRMLPSHPLGTACGPFPLARVWLLDLETLTRKRLSPLPVSTAVPIDLDRAYGSVWRDPWDWGIRRQRCRPAPGIGSAAAAAWSHSADSGSRLQPEFNNTATDEICTPPQQPSHDAPTERVRVEWVEWVEWVEC